MNINIFQKYKVKISINASVLQPEGYETISETNIHENVDGCDLMNWIAKYLQDSEIICIKLVDNGIKFEKFNPDTGEGGTIYYKIEEQ